MAKLGIFSVTCLTVLCVCRPDQNRPFYDGFEPAALNPAWSAEKFLPGAVENQSLVVRSGNGAVKITLKHGDQIEKEKGSLLERAELLESEKLWAVEGSAYSYAFSLFMPPDFPILPTRLVIAQWKQDCETGKCDPASPVAAVRFQSGELSVNVQSGPLKEVLFRTREDVRNKWLDFQFHIKFSRGPGGRIQAWMNNRQIIDYAGKTAYSEKYGYAIPGRF
ncbi:MAG TPA: polysaccharide lyase, partial [bacterium]